MARILALVLLLCVVAQALAEDPPRVVIDQQRYADLLQKQYDRRILGVIFHVGRGHGAYRYTEEEYAEMRWFHEQGPKAFPVLLEVIKREPSPLDSPTEPLAWHGVQTRRDILGWVKQFPSGDLEPFLKEIRLQIGKWSEFPSKGEHTLAQFLSEGFDLLADHGNESDVALMEQFSENENPGIREIAMGNIKILKARLEAERNKQPAEPKEDAVAGHKAQRLDADGSLVTKPSGGDRTVDESSTSSWWLILVVVGAAAIGLLWSLLMKRK